jgi:hypothetical protein
VWAEPNLPAAVPAAYWSRLCAALPIPLCSFHAASARPLGSNASAGKDTNVVVPDTVVGVDQVAADALPARVKMRARHRTCFI